MESIRQIFIILFLMTVSVTVSYASVNGNFSLKKDNTLIDQSGRVLKIKKTFSRIISLYGAHTENLFQLGLDDEIIGVTSQDKFPVEAAEKPVFSYHDDPERFLAAKPDLVLIRPMIDRGYIRLMQRLERSGVKIVSIQPKTIDEMYQYWLILGVLSGREIEAERMVQQFREVVEQYKSLVVNITQPKSVYFEAMHKNMKTFSEGSMADFIIKTVGGINVASDGISSRGTNIAIYGKEKILSKADKIDVFLAQSGKMNQPTIELIRNEPGFSVIKAIKNNEIYIIDEQIVSRPTMRILQGIYRVGNILYPEIFGEKAKRLEVLSKVL